MYKIFGDTFIIASHYSVCMFQCGDHDYEHGTECLQLVHKYSCVRAKLIEGPDCLWKITHKKDLTTAEEYLRGRVKLKTMIVMFMSDVYLVMHLCIVAYQL